MWIHSKIMKFPVFHSSISEIFMERLRTPYFKIINFYQILLFSMFVHDCAKKKRGFFSAPESHGAAAQTAPGATNVGTGLRQSDVDQPDLGPSDNELAGA